MKSKTREGLRYFTCKKCGREVIENIYQWRKKPQKQKNICKTCLDRAELRRQTAKEMAQDAGYGHYSNIFKRR